MIIVSKGTGSNSFHTINEALSFVSQYNYPAGAQVEILIGTGVWEESIQYENLRDLEVTFRGSANGTTIIQGEEQDVGISLNNYHPEAKVTLRNLTIQNWDCGIEIMETDYNGEVTVDNCQIINNGFSHYDESPGAGIRTYSPVAITNCTIADNNATWVDPSYPQYELTGLGAGFYADVSSGLVSISDSEIINNSGKEGNALYLTGEADYLVNSNKMIGNSSYMIAGVADAGEVAAVKMRLVNNVDFRYNLVAETNQISSNEDYLIKFSYSHNLDFINNTIINNSGLIGLKTMANDGEVEVFNNLFVNNHSAHELESSAVTNYNYYWNNNLGYNDTEDPFIIPNTDPISPYGLSWTANLKSVCIDSGNPDLDNDGLVWYLDKDDQDADGSRLDIGAVTALPHYMQHKTAYKATSSQRERYHWWCFPILDTVYQGGDLLVNTVGDDFYDSMKTFYYNYNGIEQHYSLPITALDDYKLVSEQGYKLSMLDDAEMEFSGFWTDESNQVDLKAGKNLVGYFLKDSMDPRKALAPILDKLSAIKTEKWAAVKENGLWIGLLGYTFNSGMAVELTATEDCSFTWGGDEIIPVDPKTKTTPKFFEYNEEQDYVPLYVELAEIRNQPLEIGLFVNGICQGASIVDSSLVNINAYVLEDTSDIATADISFELHYGARSENIRIGEYCVKNRESGAFEAEQIDFSNQESFYYVKFDSINEDAEDISYIDALYNNYPNPFNPTTTISFSLEQKSKVEISIYNVKGQKVRTLTEEEFIAGKHSVIWDGTDNSDIAVSSGVYLYKFSINGNVKSLRKCLLLK
jgi:hypothetical protein